jgi:protein-tyrosine phosphatase
MAEVLLRRAFADAGLDVVVDSTGVSDEEEGNRMDYRATRTLKAHGIAPDESHRARQITRDDLAKQDLILPMTAQHARALRRLAKSDAENAKIRMYRTFDPAVLRRIESDSAADYRCASKQSDRRGHPKDDDTWDVDDPWYGAQSDFDECFDELQAAIPGIVEYVKKQQAVDS